MSISTALDRRVAVDLNAKQPEFFTYTFDPQRISSRYEDTFRQAGKVFAERDGGNISALRQAVTLVTMLDVARQHVREIDALPIPGRAERHEAWLRREPVGLADALHTVAMAAITPSGRWGSDAGINVALKALVEASHSHHAVYDLLTAARGAEDLF